IAILLVRAGTSGRAASDVSMHMGRRGTFGVRRASRTRPSDPRTSHLFQRAHAGRQYDDVPAFTAPHATGGMHDARRGSGSSHQKETSMPPTMKTLLFTCAVCAVAQGHDARAQPALDPSQPSPSQPSPSQPSPSPNPNPNDTNQPSPT